YSLREELDREWAVRPLALKGREGQVMLVLEDPSSAAASLDRYLTPAGIHQGGNDAGGEPMELGRFLRLAINLAAGLDKLHRRGLIHKDIKPAHILVDFETDKVWFTGFGISSRLARERQAAEPPEVIAGTLAYMAPEQTGRMNRSIDSRSDLYSLGVTFYQMLTGALPFTASDPMEWVHCHVARQPAPPAERRTEVPGVISAVVMKLLAKTAEERYQTAAGLDADLRRALAEWESRGRIDAFPLGARDLPDQLLIPECLYGREREIASLHAAFDRVVAGGGPELVLVVGQAGVGKSAVVHELHRALAPARGLFASGKFDPYRRDIPYTGLAQALLNLIRPLLVKSETELAPWRSALTAARWTWDLRRIRAKGYTDNVVDLLLGKLRRLPATTQAVLKRLACLGNSAPIATLALVQSGSEDALHATLSAAIRAGVLFRQEGTYKFLDDRVREAAYAMIPDGARAAAHLTIGRCLAARTPPGAVEESIFEVVGQLNCGAALIRSGKERERLAELNLVAGLRAKSSTAYSSALTYLTAGAALLPE